MKLRELLLAFFMLSAGMIAFAYAQQQQPSFSPSEIAIAISSNVNALASALENANRQIKTLTDKNAELQKEIDEIRPPKK